MMDSAGKMFFSIVFLIFFIPFIWGVQSPETNSILIDVKGNITCFQKKVYTLYAEETFYKRQYQIIKDELESAGKGIEKLITRGDIDMKRLDLEWEQSPEPFDLDYKTPTVEEKIAKIPDDEIAKMILNDRKKENFDYIVYLKKILEHIPNK